MKNNHSKDSSIDTQTTEQHKEQGKGLFCGDEVHQNKAAIEEFDLVDWSYEPGDIAFIGGGGIKDPWHSRPLDVHRWSEHPELVAVVEQVWQECCSDLDRAARGGPRPKLGFKNQLRVLLLDLYVAWLEDPDLCIGISMHPSAWSVRSRYNALRLSKKILTLTHRLADEGLIEIAPGSYAGPAAPGNRTTRIRASRPLRDRFEALNADRDAVHQVAGQECLILKDGEGEAAKAIEYDDTPDTNRMRQRLLAYNAVLAASFIDIPSLETPWIERTDTFGKPVKVQIGRYHQFTRRIFSRGSWELNGRFYGPWWQSIGSTDRAGIFINDSPTVEVDFTGLHLSILAAEEGVPLDTDPYLIADGAIPGVDAQGQRKMVKHLLLTALNAKSRKTAFASFRGDYPKEHPGKGLTNEELDRILGLVIERHPWLADSLGADVGIRLMYMDSLIAERVLDHFTGQGVPVLCIHDSFIIDYNRVGELKQVMAEASQAIAGRSLPVEAKAAGLDELRREGLPDHIILDFITWMQTPRSEGYLSRLAAWEQSWDQ